MRTEYLTNAGYTASCRFAKRMFECVQIHPHREAAMLTPKIRENARALFKKNGYRGIVDDAKVTAALEKLLEEIVRHSGDATSNLQVPVRAAFGS